MKLCKDCVHQSWRDCTRRMVKTPYFDVVTGELMKPIYPYCSVERERACGPDAVYFEQKKKWWKLW